MSHALDNNCDSEGLEDLVGHANKVCLAGSERADQVECIRKRQMRAVQSLSEHAVHNKHIDIC